MAVIRRTFIHNLIVSVLLFKALVRPHLEYGISIWFPYEMKDIEDIEKVQRRTTKQVKSLRGPAFDCYDTNWLFVC